jgi:hypothetical protein
MYVVIASSDVCPFKCKEKQKRCDQWDCSNGYLEFFLRVALVNL